MECCVCSAVYVVHMECCVCRAYRVMRMKCVCSAAYVVRMECFAAYAANIGQLHVRLNWSLEKITEDLFCLFALLLLISNKYYLVKTIEVHVVYMCQKYTKNLITHARAN